MALPEWALTLWQPYAFLVAHGHKPIENRPRGFSRKSFLGDFWIHAGRYPGKPKAQQTWGEVRALCDEFLGADFPLPTAEELAFSAIIGRATITTIIEPKGSLLHPRSPVPWHFQDQYGFVVKNAVAIEKPVPCSGGQGFWRVPPSVRKSLEAA